MGTPKLLRIEEKVGWLKVQLFSMGEDVKMWEDGLITTPHLERVLELHGKRVHQVFSGEVDKA